MNEPYLAKLPRGFVDLSPLADDKRVLKNPHKGWYVHYIDNGMVRPTYRDKMLPGDLLEDFPGLSHLYLRVDWADIESEEGKFDFSELDRIFAEWEGRCNFSFRFCCYETSNPYATPEWVRNAGAKGFEIESNGAIRWEPDYSDPVFLAKLDNFLGRLAEKYDGDRRVEFIDIGTYGTWGEGHTGFGSGKNYPIEVLKAHVELHLKHFKLTKLLLNDDMFSTACNAGGVDAGNEFADFCAGLGIGARDDSVCVKYYSDHFGYDTLKNGNFFAKFNETAPVDLELQHYHMVADEEMKDCFPFLEALRTAHATYAGFHGYPRPWLEKYPYFTEYAANRLGYWYFLDKLFLPECISGTKALAKLWVENRGFAPAYDPFRLELRVVGEKVYPVYSSDGLNLNWKPGRQSTEFLKLDFEKVPAGKYALELRLSEGDRAVEFAVKPNFVSADKWVKLAEIEVRAPFSVQ